MRDVVPHPTNFLERKFDKELLNMRTQLQQYFYIKEVHILQSMKRYSNWVCHKNKIPIDPKTGNNAKSNDSTTWGTYQQAKLFMEQDKSISGIGFMFSHSPYVGIDIDHCVDAQGIMSKLALDVISIFQSYTEFSPSGTGIHIICKGKLPGAGRKNSNLGWASG